MRNGPGFDETRTLRTCTRKHQLCHSWLVLRKIILASKGRIYNSGDVRGEIRKLMAAFFTSVPPAFYQYRQDGIKKSIPPSPIFPVSKYHNMAYCIERAKRFCYELRYSFEIYGLLWETQGAQHSSALLEPAAQGEASPARASSDSPYLFVKRVPCFYMMD
jgi:hypothetical protein